MKPPPPTTTKILLTLSWGFSFQRTAKKLKCSQATLKHVLARDCSKEDLENAMALHDYVNEMEDVFYAPQIKLHAHLR